MERKRKQKEASIAKKVLCSPKKSHEGNYSPNPLPKFASLMYNMVIEKANPQYVSPRVGRASPLRRQTSCICRGVKSMVHPFYFSLL